ncbi:MAG: hypothetical protein GXY24_08205 [Bacteroidales bacterium]|nr:hypothetical protein [Bacteroidales bacterium]
MRRTVCLMASLFWGVLCLLQAQDGKGGISKEVFYLMPDMAQGSVQFVGKAPATGKFNICAIDNTIRYNDKDGTELMVEIEDDMTSVVIGGVTFVPVDKVFYRLYPITGDASVAVKRDVLLLTDSKTSGYGMESQTTAVTNIMGMQDGARYYLFEDNKDVPYRMTESAFLYRGDTVLTLSKRSFQRCFPNAKDAIDAWFSQHKKMDPTKVEEVIALCREWAAM